MKRNSVLFKFVKKLLFSNYKMKNLLTVKKS